MIKRFRNVSYKSSMVKVLLFMMTTPFIFTNYNMVNAVQREITNIESSGKYTEDQHNFIIDERVKSYDDIRKLQQVSNFRFKVPDFIPDGNKVSAFLLRNLSEKCSETEILFENSNGSFSFQTFQGDPVESLKGVESDKTKAIENARIDSKKEPLKIGGITGLNITLSTTFPDREEGDISFKESKKITKYFVWQNDGAWYSIEYSSESKSADSSNILVDFSQSEILEIAQSIRYPEEVTNVRYFINRGSLIGTPVMNIYDKEDLEKAKKLLGFNPKFPLQINKGLNITSSIVRISDDSDKEKNRINYEINNFYNSKSGSITFNQAKNSIDYENIKNTGHLNEGVNGSSQIKVEKLEINGIEVFKYSLKSIVPQINYLWKENDIYYTLTFFVDTEDSDEIARIFINSSEI